MPKALIIGGSGFIGFHLSNYLIKKNWSVDIIDNYKKKFSLNDLKMFNKKASVKFIKADLLNQNAIRNISTKYEYVFHLAAIVGVENVINESYQTLINNIYLTDNAMKIAKKQKQLKKFVFFSSSEVYSGTQEHYSIKIPTVENVKLSVRSLKNKRDSYMLSKIYGEAMCFNSNLPFIILRPHNIYGPRMGMSHVIPELINKIASTKSKKIYIRNLNHTRSFCYIDDAINMIYLLSKNPKALNDTFNIGNHKEEIKIISLIKKIINIFNYEIIIKESKDDYGSVKRRCPSMKKTLNLINYKLNHNLDKGLKKTIKWYLNFFENKYDFS